MVAVSLLARPALADYVISSVLPPASVQPTVTINAGGTATINLYISGDASSPGLLNYGAEFKLAAVGSPSGSTIKFSNVQPDSYVSSPTTTSNYVFLGNSSSSGLVLPIGNGTIASRVATFPSSVDHTDITIADTTNNPNVDQPIVAYNPAAPKPSGNQLLVTLTVEAPVGAVAGDTYQLQLITANGNTNFTDNPGGISQTFPAAYTPVVITVTQNVPEPASLALVGLGIAALAARRLRRATRPREA